MCESRIPHEVSNFECRIKRSRRIFAYHEDERIHTKYHCSQSQCLTQRISQKLILYGGIHIACYLLGISIGCILRVCCGLRTLDVFGHFAILAGCKESQPILNIHTYICLYFMYMSLAARANGDFVQICYSSIACNRIR